MGAPGAAIPPPSDSIHPLLARLLPPAFAAQLPSHSSLITDTLLDLRCCHRCVLRFFGIRDRAIHHAAGCGIGSPSATASSVDSHRAPDVAVPVPKSANGHQHPSSNGHDRPVPPSSGNVCPACLGLLHTPVSEPVALARQHIEKEGYECVRTFLVSVKVPVQLAVRNRAVHLTLERALAEKGVEYKIPEVTTKGKKDVTEGQPAAKPAAAETDGPGVARPDQTVDVKDVLKHVLVDGVAEATGWEYDAESPFQIDFAFEHRPTENEFKFMADIPKAEFSFRKRRKGNNKSRGGFGGGRDKERGQGEKGGKQEYFLEGCSWEKVAAAASRLGWDEFASRNRVPIEPVSTPCVMDASQLSVTRLAVFVAGRYTKLKRGISHSRWEIDGKRLAEDSVEELIATCVDPLFKSDGHKFASAGREDVDVLMLGRGRPFYLEVLAPKKLSATLEEMAAVEKEINERAGKGFVKVSDLQVVTNASTKALKDSASTKRKSYTTVVLLSRPVTLAQMEEISKMSEIALQQQTPVRVSARRTDMTRDKIIHAIRVYPAEAAAQEEFGLAAPTDDAAGHTLIRMDVTTSAGTYVKEFVHSDGGRTVPSLQSLLLGGVEAGTCEVKSLDVTDVELDWPPPTLFAMTIRTTMIKGTTTMTTTEEAAAHGRVAGTYVAGTSTLASNSTKAITSGLTTLRISRTNDERLRDFDANCAQTYIVTTLNVPSSNSSTAAATLTTLAAGLHITSSDALRVLLTPNAGGDSLLSEALSAEWLMRAVLPGATLLATEMQIAYFPRGGSILDYMLRDARGRSVGVSVTRAFAHERFTNNLGKVASKFTMQQAERILTKKLVGIQFAGRNVYIPAEGVDVLLLHVFVPDGRVAKVLRRAYAKLGKDVRGETVVVVTVCNARSIFLKTRGLRVE
ncbi:putative tRNA pseudouridine synthase Pus10 [Irineochytrium annulatum]|nr:putative tRNA pseudouridine synthase Pus10 [Irineochytrium annulatum]